MDVVVIVCVVADVALVVVEAGVLVGVGSVAAILVLVVVVVVLVFVVAVVVAAVLLLLLLFRLLLFWKSLVIPLGIVRKRNNFFHNLVCFQTFYRHDMTVESRSESILFCVSDPK